MNDTSLMNNETCQIYGVDIVTNTTYRIIQLIHIILSISSILLIFYVLRYSYRKFHFHYNIRVLLFSLYIASLIHSILLASFQIYQLQLSYTFNEPCDVFLNKYVYASIWIPYSFCIAWIEFLQVLMIIERTTATLLVRFYEHSGKKLGNILATLSILCPFLLTLPSVIGEKFDRPQISCINTPGSKVNYITAVFSTMTLLNVIAIGILIILYIVNRTREAGWVQQAASRKNITSGGFTLSSRYQNSENITTARYLAIISSVQLIVFLYYGIGQIILRTYFAADQDWRNPYVRSATMAFYSVPLFTFLLPIITISNEKRAKEARQQSIVSMLQVKSSGSEGWDNYAAIINKQWL